VAALAALVSTLGSGLPGLAGAAASPARQPVASTPTADSFSWPEFHGSPTLAGVSADPGISTANASGLGVAWMSPTGPGLDSAAVAWDATLGQMLAYVGNRDGFLQAVDVATGAIVWSDFLGTAVTSSPLVEGGDVWIAPTAGGLVYKLDASTGATLCTGPIQGPVLSSPVAATPPGGVPTVYFGALDTGGAGGWVDAYQIADCSPLWQWSTFVSAGAYGVWSPLSYAVDATGEGLVVFGSADTDSTVYAVDAVTGASVWHYSTYMQGTEDWDVGAGATLSPPGTNGFADGVAYVEGKDGILYALDLTTGDPLWQFNFGGNAPGNPVITDTDALATPALSGDVLVFGDATDLYAVNATTGAVLWSDPSSAKINSSAAIVGPPGEQVVAYGDLDGNFDVVNLATGQLLYHYRTPTFITASPADANGTLLVASYDGDLYDFAPGGANGPAPKAAISSPGAGSILANPMGSVTITGTASGSAGVAAVDVQVQADGSTGSWYHQATGVFSPGLSTASATLATPGGRSTTWSLSLPVPAVAGQYQVLVSAVGANGIAGSGPSGIATEGFDVESSPSAPTVTATPARVPPGGTVTVGASGFTPGEQVAFTVVTSSGKTDTLATVSAGPTGATAPVNATVPVASTFGADPVTATGSTSGLVGTAFTYVANDDPQLGYGPLHQGDEANDNVIATYQAIKGTLYQAWSAGAGAATDTTPAIVGGVAYFGDEAGNLHAIEETSGQSLFTVADGAPIESSPAVDGGAVYFGDDAGNAVAVAAADGSPIWKTALGSAVSSPAVADGVVYLGTAGGRLAALDETTGAVNWTVPAGGAVTAPPAVDAPDHLVVVTTATGLVTAVSSTTGDLVWTYQIGGAATGPMISSGRVYVASTTGAVVSLKESDGALMWSHNTGSSVAASPILAFGKIAVGNGAGAISYFIPRTGVLASTETQFGRPITGLSITASDILATSSAGQAGIIQGSAYRFMNWRFTGPAPYASPGVLLNGDVFLLGGDGQLRAFTIPGRSVA